MGEIENANALQRLGHFTLSSRLQCRHAREGVHPVITLGSIGRSWSHDRSAHTGFPAGACQPAGQGRTGRRGMTFDGLAVSFLWKDALRVEVTDAARFGG